MTQEEKDLLARIGQVAGQINRHKSQGTGSASNYTNRSPIRSSSISVLQSRLAINYGEGNAYHRRFRGRGAYSSPLHRVDRPQISRPHRTLHLNPSVNAPETSASGAGGLAPRAATWVSRVDRHRQLINADVYEQQSQTRAKAIEVTRKMKVQQQKCREKAQLDIFLRHGTVTAPATVESNSLVRRNEIRIDGIRFHVAAGGKKLVKALDDRHLDTPKTAIVAGVRFHRTRTGNLVLNRIVQNQRRSGKRPKLTQCCKVFSTTGSCSKGPSCRYQHDPVRVAVCKDYLKDGKCSHGDSCDLSHDLTPERVPNCLHHAKGLCSKPGCNYAHTKAAPGALVCEAFGFYGFCDRGAECTERHVFECPDFSNTGVCKSRGCRLLHRERASLLRNQPRADDTMDEDVSSNDEPVDSDDVDSDEVAEFIDADSDDSDFENGKDFIEL